MKFSDALAFLPLLPATHGLDSWLRSSLRVLALFTLLG
jgi:hypothetical protein